MEYVLLRELKASRVSERSDDDARYNGMYLSFYEVTIIHIRRWEP